MNKKWSFQNANIRPFINNRQTERETAQSLQHKNDALHLGKLGKKNRAGEPPSQCMLQKKNDPRVYMYI